MNVTAVEGTVENGQVKLPPDVHLPDHTKVYVVIPGIVVTPRVHVGSPRLAHPKDAADFQMEVIQELPDAGV
jgi:hypothetical protein